MSVYDVSKTHVSELIGETFRCSHIVLASMTYNMGIFTPMKNFLLDLEAHNLQNRTYALIENVVTHAEHRGRGCAGACLDYARDLARAAGCYKLMLLTGAKDAQTLHFYEQAGYNRQDKTAFIQWI